MGSSILVCIITKLAQAQKSYPDSHFSTSTIEFRNVGSGSYPRFTIQ